MPTDEELQAYYALDRERDRLAVGIGRVEFDRTIEILQRTLPPPPAVVADIGGGPGRYTDWLLERGYAVIHRDIVADHVDQVRHRHGDAVDTAVGNAMRLDIDDGVADVVLLLGPLYHLESRVDRVQAFSEAARVTAADGMIHAAAIGRWSARQAMVLERQYLTRPETLSLVDDVESTGVIPALFEGSFNGYTHTPDQLRDEAESAPLRVVSLLAIEGPASLFTAADLEERLTDSTDRAVLYGSLRALEAVPSLLGVSAHLLVSAQHRHPVGSRTQDT